MPVFILSQLWYILGGSLTISALVGLFALAYEEAPIGRIAGAGSFSNCRAVSGPFLRPSFLKICEKAGFPGTLSLLILVPFLNFVLLFWLAFAKWPSLNRNK